MWPIQHMQLTQCRYYEKQSNQQQNSLPEKRDILTSQSV